MNSEAYRSTPVLVVDDDKDVLHAISDTLMREGYRVEVCLNPLEAYSRIESGDASVDYGDAGD